MLKMPVNIVLPQPNQDPDMQAALHHVISMFIHSPVTLLYGHKTRQTM